MIACQLSLPTIELDARSALLMARGPDTLAGDGTPRRLELLRITNSSPGSPLYERTPLSHALTK